MAKTTKKTPDAADLTTQTNEVFALHFEGRLLTPDTWRHFSDQYGTTGLQGWKPPKKLYYKAHHAKNGKNSLPAEVQQHTEVVRYVPEPQPYTFVVWDFGYGDVECYLIPGDHRYMHNVYGDSEDLSAGSGKQVQEFADLLTDDSKVVKDHSSNPAIQNTDILTGKQIYMIQCGWDADDS